MRALFRRPDVALACAAALGLPTARVGQGFICVLPGHHERRASASLHWDLKTESLKYHDWHARDGEAWYTLPDVQPSPRHPLLWWGMNSTVFGKYPLDRHPEPYDAS